MGVALSKCRASFRTLIMSCDPHIFNDPRDASFHSHPRHPDKVLISLPSRENETRVV